MGMLDAAIACILEHGFERTTMDEIAERADVARSTVFNHFPEKEAVLSAYLERRRVLARELLEREADAGLPAEQRLYDVMDLLAQLNERRVDEARTLVLAWQRAGSTTRTEPATGQIVGSVIEAGQEAGELRGDCDPYVVGALLLDAYVGVLLRWVGDEGDPEPRFPLREAVREVCRLVIEGLLPAASRAEGEP